MMKNVIYGPVELYYTYYYADIPLLMVLMKRKYSKVYRKVFLLSMKRIGDKLVRKLKI
jgi:hypothetical protein